VTWAASRGAEGDVELGGHVHRAGLHGPPRDVLPLADLRAGQAWTPKGLGVVQRLAGVCPAATASLTRALELFRDLGDWHGQAGAPVNLGELLSLSLAYREARGSFVQALSIARDIGTPAGEAQAREGIGRSRIQEGNPGQGARNLQQALAIYPPYRRPGGPACKSALPGQL
jgi:tetratricopeptide (TPR) repeat protein